MTSALPADRAEDLRRWAKAVTHADTDAAGAALQAAWDEGEFSVRLLLRALQESGHAVDVDWKDGDTAREQMNEMARSLNLDGFESSDDSTNGSDRIEQLLRAFSRFLSDRGHSLFEVDLGDDAYRAVAVRSIDEAAFAALSVNLDMPTRRL